MAAERASRLPELVEAVIVSNGFSKFHLAVAAEELHRRGLLARLITGAYPTAGIRWILPLLRWLRIAKAKRLDQRIQKIPDELVSPLFLADAMFQFAMMLRRFRLTEPVSAFVDVFSFRLYSWFAAGIVRRAPNTARIYHYRAGFGHSSLPVARRRGMIALCDHSIVHPALVEYLGAHDGRFPAGPIKPETRLWRTVDADIRQADHVLVNSDFVHDTFLRMGWDPARLHVIYWGVDDSFLSAVDADARKKIGDKAAGLRLLFAGAFERRKGAEVLITALGLLDDICWRLTIAGAVDPPIRAAHARFLSSDRVRMLGTLSRAELAREMSVSEVFVFPSLAEGSARVIFEALAAGCYVITTPNSGSIVEDGIHGTLVPPGDAQALATAVRLAANNRPELRRIGQSNANLIRRSYRQTNYGDALVTLYRRLYAGELC